MNGRSIPARRLLPREAAAGHRARFAIATDGPAARCRRILAGLPQRHKTRSAARDQVEPTRWRGEPNLGNVGRAGIDLEISRPRLLPQVNNARPAPRSGQAKGEG